MAPPIDPRTQSPPHLQGAKPTNVDKMVTPHTHSPTKLYIILNIFCIHINLSIIPYTWSHLTMTMILLSNFLKPDRNQIESRLNQIRDYIKVTVTMMDSLSQSSDPVSITFSDTNSVFSIAKYLRLKDFFYVSIFLQRAQAQNEKLARMVEDLRDSERKLSKLLEQYHNHGVSDEVISIIRRLKHVYKSSKTQYLVVQNSENDREDMDERGDAIREMQLRRNMEEYQTKLALLQEHQASLVGMQMRFRERLNEARHAQQMLLQQENQNTLNSAAWEGNQASLPGPTNVEQLESETAALRGKLAQLQTKKKQMDHLVAELQAIEASDRGSCVSFAPLSFFYNIHNLR